MPSANTPWPPKALANITPMLTTWGAWYTGNPDDLSAVYGGAIDLSAGNAAGFYDQQIAANRGGVIGTIARWFWGTKPTPGQRRVKLHVPVAADLCPAAADLLFADPPTFKVNGAPDDRLTELLDDDALATLAECFEMAAALGGAYLRVSWDKQVVPDRPFFTTVGADAALPTFRWGRLVDVTFWRVVSGGSDSRVLRHLEHHYLDAAGTGWIAHALFEGANDNLGHRVPLTESPDTSALALVVDESSTISTESPGLAVTYVPNQRPQRRWRTDPLGVNFGRSDLDGVEGLMDSLDEVYTSWMRDIRLGKARIILPDSMLDSLGPGKGAVADLDREVYTGVKGLVNTKDGSLPVEKVQFTIRWQEHQSTAQQLLVDIFRTAGYSTQTFGEGRETKTATEVEARERRSLLTRDRKIRTGRPALTAGATKLAAVDAAMFAKKTIGPITVTFPDGVQETQLALAQTAQALSAATAASTETMVRMLHPDWDDDAVTAEVALIQSEHAMAVPDPTTFGRGGSGQPTDPGDGSDPSGPTG